MELSFSRRMRLALRRIARFGFSLMERMGTWPRAVLGRQKDDRLHGWKEIANYLGINVKTAQRWEKQRDLPIRKIPGQQSATRRIFAYRDEVEAWLASSGIGTKQGGPQRVRSVAPPLVLATALLIGFLGISFLVLSNAVRFSDTQPNAGVVPSDPNVRESSYGPILFVSDRSGWHEVWQMEPDGSGQLPLTELRGRAIQPRSSPDGTWIAFIGETAGPDPTSTAVYLMDALAVGVRVLLDERVLGSRITSLSWSPDGRHLAVGAGSGCCSGGVWILDVRTLTVRSLFRGSYVGLVEFSPDGRWVLHNERLSADSFSHPLRIASVAGGENATIIADCCGENTTVVDAAWERRRRRVLASFGHDIWLIDPFELFLRYRLTSGSSEEPKLYFEGARWSPDSRRVVYTRATDTESQIWVMDADGTNHQALTNAGNNTSPDWARQTDTDRF